MDMQNTYKRAESIVDYMIGFFEDQSRGFKAWWSEVDGDDILRMRAELSELVALILDKEPYYPIKHHAASLGRIGGKVKSDAKTRAARENSKKAGRPRKKLALGDRVRVRGHNGTAIIAALYHDIPGGVRLDREIGGFFSWNAADLIRVRGKKTTPAE